MMNLAMYLGEVQQPGANGANPFAPIHNRHLSSLIPESALHVKSSDSAWQSEQ
jgi:hypothetical protein